MSKHYGVKCIDSTDKLAQQSAETPESKSNDELVKQLGGRVSDLEECRTAIIEKGVEVPEGTSTSEYGDKIRAISSGIAVNESYDISEGKLNTATITLEGDVVANIPDGVVTLGGGAFAHNPRITKVVMPDSVTTIEDSAPWANVYGCFYDCKALKSVVFSSAITAIGNYAFSSCTGLTSITIPDSVTSIGNDAFSSCTGLTSITIPDSVTSIGVGAFGRCTGLTSITIPDSVTSIDSGAFNGCTGLTSITIPDSVTTIGDEVFRSCTSLTSITIPDSVTRIGNYTFYDCTSLTDIYYTGTQAEWEQITIGTQAIPEGATIHYEYTPT